jgi:ribose 5-phosphate isomerase B
MSIDMAMESVLKIGLAADHGGFAMKEVIKADLETNGFQVCDFGALNFDPTDDFPDTVIPLAQAVAKGEVQRGIAICGSGVGACIAANKVAGVRAALITETYSAHQGVEHDDLNLLCLGGLIIGNALAWELITAFLKARYTGEERHQRRLDKIKRLENQVFQSTLI